MKKLLITQLSLLLLFTTIMFANEELINGAGNAIGGSTPPSNNTNLVQSPFKVGGVLASKEILDDGSIKLTASKEGAYGFIRMSQSGWEGTLTEDLNVGDSIKVSLTLVPSTKNFYMTGSGLSLAVTKPNVENQEITIVKEMKVTENVYGHYIALHIKHIGESVIVKNIHVEKVGGNTTVPTDNGNTDNPALSRAELEALINAYTANTTYISLRYDKVFIYPKASRISVKEVQ